ncbi:uncharacterized protein ARMOST_15291 [Armillaria ostoyae]|uniref:Uncharacterized protein n=1 Tax=Armillaria ostoyae TaxID=47428 RepID=A0A284RT17_ARMOS|nr:uncharacterized protein ARMOST_15291 [Armillaria ostoyae]
MTATLSVLPSPSSEVFPYPSHWQQAIHPDDHARPTTAAKDPEGHLLQEPLFLSPNALCSLSFYLSALSNLIALGHPAPTTIDLGHSISLKEAIGRTSLKGIGAAAWTTDTEGHRFYTQYAYFGCRTTLDD